MRRERHTFPFSSFFSSPTSPFFFFFFPLSFRGSSNFEVGSGGKTKSGCEEHVAFFLFSLFFADLFFPFLAACWASRSMLAGWIAQETAPEKSRSFSPLFSFFTFFLFPLCLPPRGRENGRNLDWCLSAVGLRPPFFFWNFPLPPLIREGACQTHPQ